MTAVDLGPAGKDNDYGTGRVDAFRAMAELRYTFNVSVMRLQPGRNDKSNNKQNDNGFDRGGSWRLRAGIQAE